MENVPNYFNTNGSIVSNGKVHTYCKGDVCINVTLPKELIIRVFSYLDISTLCRCSQVCKFWYECAFDGSNWKSINLFDFQRYVQPKVVEKIAQRSRGFLRELRLKGCRDVTDEALQCFTQMCHMIESLDLSGCQNLTNGTCDYLGKNCSFLTTLSLESCSRIDDVGMEVLSCCSNLTCLDVSWCSVGDRGLTAIARGCKKLQLFRAIGCQEITSRGVEQLAGNCHDLLLLNLNYCGQGVTDEAIIYLSSGCPDLRVLAVSHCFITDQGLRALAGTLSIAAAAAIIGQTANIGQQQNGIRPAPTSNGVINGRDSNDNGHADGQVVNRDCSRRAKLAESTRNTIIPVGCINLTTLEVARCSAVTDVGLSAVARVCTKLEKLDLEDCGLVTDAALAQLAVHCPQLNTLVLSHCDQITDEGIAHLAEGLCGADHLQTLAMDNCPLLTDAALEHLGSNCRKLRQLDLYDCQLITKQGITNFENQYPQLQIHAYFAPGTPPASTLERRRRYCRCCRIL